MENIKNQKEAIAIVKQMVADGQISQEVAEKYFPELIESEDKNIRKMIINVLNRDKILTEDEAYDCVAWLEKYGEQKPTAEEVLIKAGLKPYKDGNQWCILVGNNIQEGICGFGDTIEDALYEFLKEVCKTRQKTVGWSEEDKYLLDETIKHLEVLIKIIKKQGSAYSDEIQYYQRDIDWLKSLKERCTWKPSGEQMGALWNSIKHDLPLHQILESLYNDLKILKG